MTCCCAMAGTAARRRCLNNYYAEVPTHAVTWAPPEIHIGGNPSPTFMDELAEKIARRLLAEKEMI